MNVRHTCHSLACSPSSTPSTWCSFLRAHLLTHKSYLISGTSTDPLLQSKRKRLRHITLFRHKRKHMPPHRAAAHLSQCGPKRRSYSHLLEPRRKQRRDLERDTWFRPHRTPQNKGFDDVSTKKSERKTSLLSAPHFLAVFCKVSYSYI